VLFDADNERLGLVTEYEHPTMGLLRQFGNTIDFSETPSSPWGPPPRIGEDTREILEWLGADDARVAELADQGVVAWPGDPYAAPW
jgi:crotonobetainyl-CoA:carnitine CoA-transferase CaiB-like acyl-CoA transferase